MHRILITGRNRSVPRDAFAAVTPPQVHRTRMFIAGDEIEIPCRSYLRATQFRQAAGVRGGRHPSHPCMFTRRIPAPSVQPHPSTWRGGLSIVAMMLAASCVVVGVLTVALL